MTEVHLCHCDPPRQLIRHDGYWFHVEHSIRLGDPCPDEGGFIVVAVDWDAHGIASIAEVEAAKPQRAFPTIQAR